VIWELRGLEVGPKQLKNFTLQSVTSENFQRFPKSETYIFKYRLYILKGHVGLITAPELPGWRKFRLKLAIFLEIFMRNPMKNIC
jgi:hypothetical protein